MRALITGASGFLGSHLVDRLLRSADCEVRVLVRRTSDLRWLQGKPVEMLYGNVTQSPEELANAVAGVDRVFHLAGLTKAVNPSAFYAVNETGTENLIRACLAQTTPPTRFVLVSSAGATGPSPDETPLTEEVAERPVTEYGRSKLAAERVAWRFADRMSTTVLRPGAIYGPRDFEMLPAFRAVKRGLALRLGRRPHLVNLAFVEDVAQAIEIASASPAADGQLYLIGGANSTQGEVVEAIIRALDKRFVLRLSVPDPLIRLAAATSSAVGRLSKKPRIFTLDNANRLLARYWALDIGKAQRELGYRPEWELDRGFAETVRWYRAESCL